MTDKAEQEERRRVILKDRQWRENAKRQGASSYHEMAQTSVGEELGGRFAHLARNQTIVAAADPKVAVPRMPANSPWSRGIDEVSAPEEPLGFSVEDIGEPIGTSAEIEASLEPRASVEQSPCDSAAPDAPAHASVASIGVGTPSNQFKRRV
jgi:hypothetical protein